MPRSHVTVHAGRRRPRSSSTIYNGYHITMHRLYLLYFCLVLSTWCLALRIYPSILSDDLHSDNLFGMNIKRIYCLTKSQGTLPSKVTVQSTKSTPS